MSDRTNEQLIKINQTNVCFDQFHTLNEINEKLTPSRERPRKNGRQFGLNVGVCVCVCFLCRCKSWNPLAIAFDSSQFFESRNVINSNWFEHWSAQHSSRELLSFIISLFSFLFSFFLLLLFHFDLSKLFFFFFCFLLFFNEMCAANRIHDKLLNTRVCAHSFFDLLDECEPTKLIQLEQREVQRKKIREKKIATLKRIESRSDAKSRKNTTFYETTTWNKSIYL